MRFIIIILLLLSACNPAKQLQKRDEEIKELKSKWKEELAKQSVEAKRSYTKTRVIYKDKIDSIPYKVEIPVFVDSNKCEEQERYINSLIFAITDRFDKKIDGARLVIDQNGIKISYPLVNVIDTVYDDNLVNQLNGLLQEKNISISNMSGQILTLKEQIKNANTKAWYGWGAFGLLILLLIIAAILYIKSRK